RGVNARDAKRTGSHLTNKLSGSPRVRRLGNLCRNGYGREKEANAESKGPRRRGHAMFTRRKGRMSPTHTTGGCVASLARAGPLYGEVTCPRKGEKSGFPGQLGPQSVAYLPADRDMNDAISRPRSPRSPLSE